MKLSIKNFQSIASSELDFRGFTCIVGKSNLGKSALLRALRTVLFNDMHPTYIRNGASEAALTVAFDVLPLPTIDPATLAEQAGTWHFQRGKTTNTFTALYPDGTRKEFPKVGKDTPPELQDLGFFELQSSRDETFNLNFQAQLDPLFAVTLLPTSLTSMLNSLFKIDRFERAGRAMATDLVKNTQAFNAAGADLKRAEGNATAAAAALQALVDQHTNLVTPRDQFLAARQQADRANEANDLFISYEATRAHQNALKAQLHEAAQRSAGLVGFVKLSKNRHALLTAARDDAQAADALSTAIRQRERADRLGGSLSHWLTAAKTSHTLRSFQQAMVDQSTRTTQTTAARITNHAKQAALTTVQRGILALGLTARIKHEQANLAPVAAQRAQLNERGPAITAFIASLSNFQATMKLAVAHTQALTAKLDLATAKVAHQENVTKVTDLAQAIQAELRNRSKTCPTCGQPVNDPLDPAVAGALGHTHSPQSTNDLQHA